MAKRVRAVDSAEIAAVAEVAAVGGQAYGLSTVIRHKRMERYREVAESE